MSTMSRRANQWIKFSTNVTRHVNEYTVAQYGDMPFDPASDFTVDEICEDAEKFFCSSEASRYAKRYITEQLGEE